MKTRNYKITWGDNGQRWVMVVRHLDGEEIATYACDKLSDIKAMYRQVDKHLAKPGATLGNYEW